MSRRKASDDLLGDAVDIHVGGIDERDPTLDRASEDPLGLGSRRALAEVHGAQSDGWAGAFRAPRGEGGQRVHGLSIPFPALGAWCETPRSSLARQARLA